MNVLNDPWIPVRTQENQHIRVTLPDFYAHAHEYRSLETENAFDEFSLARFLALFAHCAYEPKNDDAIEELAEEGKFPMKPIYDYIALCKSEGVTFELFDKERPFLQAIPDDAFDTEKTLSPVSKMDYIYAYDNTPIHRSQKFEDEYSYRVEDCPIKLLSQYVYSRHKAQGYETSPAGTPTFYLPNGENLFLTILFSIPLVNKDREGEIEFWRSLYPVVPRREVPVPSLRYGTIFPCRRIVLKAPEEDGLVHACYYQPGLHMAKAPKGTYPWDDDAVAITKDAKGAIKPLNLQYSDDDLEIFKRLLAGTPTFPACVRRYARYLRENGGILHTPFVAFVTATNQANYLGIRKLALLLRPAIFENDATFFLLRGFLDFARGDTYPLLRRTMVNGLSEQTDSYMPRVESYLVRYRQDVTDLFFQQADQLEAQPISLDEAKEKLLDLYEVIQKLAFKTFDEAMPALSASVLNLGSIEAERRRLFSLLAYAKATHIKKEKLPDRKKEQA